MGLKNSEPGHPRAAVDNPEAEVLREGVVFLYWDVWLENREQKYLWKALE